jgi:hypothetical protein
LPVQTLFNNRPFINLDDPAIETMDLEDPAIVYAEAYTLQDKRSSDIGWGQIQPNNNGWWCTVPGKRIGGKLPLVLLH